MGNPAQLERLVTGIWHRCGESHLTGVHLHNTRGQGLANALRAVERALPRWTVLSAAWAVVRLPGASGNIVTEDLVFMLESMGYDTGIDLEALLSVRQEVARLLPEEEWFGFTAAAGLPSISVTCRCRKQPTWRCRRYWSATREPGVGSRDSRHFARGHRIDYHRFACTQAQWFAMVHQAARPV